MKTDIQNAQEASGTTRSHCKDTNPSIRTFRESIRFGFVGIINTAIDFTLFLLLTNVCHWNLLAAQTVSYLIGLINSYIWNRKLTFNSMESSVSGEVMRFIGLNIVSYLISLFILSILGQLSVSNVVSKILVTFATFAVNFIGSKWWVFRQHASGMNKRKNHDLLFKNNKGVFF